MMDGGSNNIDKSKVLDVKPLRSLMPVFPNGNEGPPFVCASPSGPFPAGFTPIYPFSAPKEPEPTPDLNQTHMPSFPTPIRSFKSPDSIPSGPPSGPSGASNGDTDLKDSRKVRKSRDRDISYSSGRGKAAMLNFDSGINPEEKEDGNRELVNSVLMRFDALRRKLSQLEDAKESPTGIIRRADLKAANIAMTRGVRTNMRKRVGPVPGVEIGDIFFFRMELCLVGVHAPSMAGIDYMVVRGDIEEEPVAICIVSSGGYDDDTEDTDVLVYSGQGGNAYKNKQASDQKLERGNLALERSLRRGNAVRVIRGLKDGNSVSSKVYVYDGLYVLKESWTEKGKSGCNTFKYKLMRMPDQPGAFSVYKTIKKWKEAVSTRVGLIIPDLASGVETLPVALVNDVDDEKGPGYFTYYPSVKYSKSFKLVDASSFNCTCSKACQPGNLNCSCIRKNGGDFPYTTNGVLVCRKPLIYECSRTCPCFANCKNQVSQTGLKVRLEVFKTKDRGWGLRSWDPIRAGTFICEYAGEVVDKLEARRDGDGDSDDNEYVFDTTRVYGSLKWNYEPGLIDEDGPDDSPEDVNAQTPLIISSKTIGNVARFMNHSCYPNAFWQPIVYEHNNDSFMHIGFFAMKHIPPMTEITFDYGIARADETEENSALFKKKRCLCGSPNCRGYYIG